MDALFIVRMQEEFQKKDKKLYIVDMERAFDRVQRKVMEWAMRKKGLSKVMVQVIMSSYDDAKTRMRVGSAYSKEFEVKVGVHQGFGMSLLLFAIVVDVITENARGEVNECMQMTLFHEQNRGRFKGKILELEGALESKSLKVNTRKTSDGKWVRRKTIQKQDRSMWSLLEKSHNQFSVGTKC